MKKSAKRDSQRPKLVLQRETIVLLRLPELGEVQSGGRTVTIFTKAPEEGED
jgi:hypothetical protein